jgi:hypothetical protein
MPIINPRPSRNKPPRLAVTVTFVNAMPTTHAQAAPLTQMAKFSHNAELAASHA